MPLPAPPPLLPTLNELARIEGVGGRLSLEIGPFGQVTAVFEPDQLHRNLDWMRCPGPRDLHVELSATRSVELRTCYTRRISFSLGENKAPPRVEFSPIGGVVVRTSLGKASVVECALGNLWIPEIAPLQFDGLDVQFRPAEAGGPSYVDLWRGDLARVTWWARCATPTDGNYSHVLEKLRCFADVVSLLVDERVRVPCYREFDRDGSMVLFHCDNVQ